MGPRPIGRGNTSISRPIRFRFWKLQWGRDQLVAETTGTIDGEMHANLLQWGRDQLVAETRGMGRISRQSGCTPCFNGAATNWSRKLNQIKNMLPLNNRFNGAATNWSRKPDPQFEAQALTLKLQWGRDQLVAET